MTIALPDLSGYTNIQMSVALAAPEAYWEITHRDRVEINSDTESIDLFRPTSGVSDLISRVSGRSLTREFQDHTYPISQSYNSITFIFASTAYPEVLGIDSVEITGGPLVLAVDLDIKPGSCPNPLHLESKGVLPVAFLGT